MSRFASLAFLCLGLRGLAMHGAATAQEPAAAVAAPATALLRVGDWARYEIATRFNAQAAPRAVSRHTLVVTVVEDRTATVKIDIQRIQRPQRQNQGGAGGGQANNGAAGGGNNPARGGQLVKEALERQTAADTDPLGRAIALLAEALPVGAAVTLADGGTRTEAELAIGDTVYKTVVLEHRWASPASDQNPAREGTLKTWTLANADTAFPLMQMEWTLPVQFGNQAGAMTYQATLADWGTSGKLDPQAGVDMEIPVFQPGQGRGGQGGGRGQGGRGAGGGGGPQG